ncbi:hypothetical protein HMPREF9700_00033 [Bergeyella zoohelcum CCUG 30536]|uniref:Sodium/panthothenate symporter n=2 Tax=Bergeyella zoohelcum TaxID=1015 RepID=A0A380ZSS3_9FLAO|nr:hypothetical protein HMPREF9700_00033 [Bergeyella zoohelcum CCUG 30536]SUV52383.1 sodium/panthothenate symporter [Bergeyella zoohelcum]
MENSGNYIAIAIYLLGLLFLTLRASKNKSEDDFLSASKNVGWKSLSVSIFASVISSYNIVVGLSFAYLFGPWVAFIYLGALSSFFVIYHLVTQKNKEQFAHKSFTSIIDFLAQKFGRVNASIFNLSFMIVLFLFIAVQFFVNTTIFSELMGWDKYVSALFVGIVVLLYIVKGGLKVEILTDVFQGVLMLLFIGLLFFVDTSHLTLSTFTPFLKDSTIIVSAVALGVSQFLTLLVQPEVWQRIYASKSSVDLKKGILASMGLVLLFIIPIIIIGLSARATGIEVNPDTFFYSILETTTPQWFLPFIAVALFAAFMSSLDSAIFALATQMGKYGLWIKKDVEVQEENKLNEVKNIKRSVFAIVITTLITSLFFSDFLTSVLQIMSLLTVDAVVILLGIRLKLSYREITIALVLGTACFLIASFGGFISSEPYAILYPSIAVVLFIIVQSVIRRIMCS